MQHPLQDSVYIRGMESPEWERPARFCDWLREKLNKKDVSARRFGMALGVSATTASTWANGDGYPTRDRLPAIAAYFGVPESEVWEAYREAPGPRYGDATLMRLLDLPDVVRRDELILLKHLFRAMRAAEAEMEEREERSR